MRNRARPANIFRRAVLQLSLLLSIITIAAGGVAAQSLDPSILNPANLSASVTPETSSSKPDTKPNDEPSVEAAKSAASQFRIERLTLAHGAELLTIFGRLDGMRTPGSLTSEVPLISVVR